MTKEEFTRLADRISEGTASPQDIARYNFYYNHFQATAADAFEETAEKDHIDKQLRSRIGLDKVVPVRRLHPYWKVAAAVVLLAAIVFLFRDNTETQTIAGQSQTERFKYDAAPGGNEAILTLADGKKIVLNDLKDGTQINQGDIAISKTSDGQLVYDASSFKGTARQTVLTFNTIATPRGGQYMVILPDGTKVWLNSASSLKFPTTFTGEERKVELTGEAYFEVAKKVKGEREKGEKMPFIVKSGSQQVEVLGTHFNVMAYQDEAEIKTTLLEGSVRVSHPGTHHSHLLKPGQQAKTDKSGQIDVVSNIDTDEITAWKNGMFQFNNTDMQTIMRQLERWYNVDADEEHMPHKRFNGIISRDVPLSQVLKMMEITSGLKFKIEELAAQGSQPERRISMGE